MSDERPIDEQVTYAVDAGVAVITIDDPEQGNALTGGFQSFAGICLGPIQALALSDTTIYAGDIVGGVVRFDLATGDFLGATFVPDSVTAMAWDGDGVLVSEGGGTIWRLDPQNGAILDTSPSSEDDSGAMTPTTPVGSGMLKSK